MVHVLTITEGGQSNDSNKQITHDTTKLIKSLRLFEQLFTWQSEQSFG